MQANDTRTIDALRFSEVPDRNPYERGVAHELRFSLLDYRDPADRFLVATAKVYDLTLVPADERLMNVPGIQVLPNL